MYMCSIRTYIKVWMHYTYMSLSSLQVRWLFCFLSPSRCVFCLFSSSFRACTQRIGQHSGWGTFLYQAEHASTSVSTVHGVLSRATNCTTQGTWSQSELAVISIVTKHTVSLCMWFRRKMHTDSRKNGIWSPTSLFPSLILFLSPFLNCCYQQTHYTCMNALSELHTSRL